MMEVNLLDLLNVSPGNCLLFNVSMWMWMCMCMLNWPLSLDARPLKNHYACHNLVCSSIAANITQDLNLIVVKRTTFCGNPATLY